MPKKKPETEKTFDKKDKILEEIADKLKEIEDEELSDKENSEKSGLEEDVNLNTLQFQQFIQSSEETPIPVLERIASAQPRPVFVGTLPQAQAGVTEENSGKENSEYVPGLEGNNEQKYTESYARISREPVPVDLIKAGRRPAEIIPQVDQEAFFRRSEPLLQIESSIPEQTWGAERIDTKKAGRKDLFEAEQEKYKTYKPKLQKSY